MWTTRMAWRKRRSRTATRPVTATDQPVGEAEEDDEEGDPVLEVWVLPPVDADECRQGEDDDDNNNADGDADRFADAETGKEEREKFF